MKQIIFRQERMLGALWAKGRIEINESGLHVGPESDAVSQLVVPEFEHGPTRYTIYSPEPKPSTFVSGTK